MPIMTEPVAPTLEAIARGLDQNADQLQATRDRLDAHIQASSLYFVGMDKQFDGLRDTIRSQHLLVSADIAAARRDIATVEEHVALLTTMATANANRLDEHDKRFDALDQRLDEHDKRLDGIDQRLDGIDRRLDGIDQRLDGIDRRLNGIDRHLDTLTDVVVQIRDAVLPGDR